jgi:iron complex outermembrane recepter protein
MRRTLILLFLVMFFAGSALSDEVKTVQLEPIVVTPYRYETNMMGITSSFSVITNDEIENSTGSITDILRKQAGIFVTDYYGNNVKTSVDLRGFGETSQMNTLVLVNGRRINSTDLSGVDWYQVPKELVERIEILKSSGSVLYGDNAGGGVINIITKKSIEPFGVKLEQNFGSYSAFTSIAQAQFSNNNIGMFLNARRTKTDGYRKNTYAKGTDLFSSLKYKVTDKVMCDFDAHYNELSFGLPGALSEADLETRSRKDSKYPKDQVSQEDWHLNAQPQIRIYDNIVFTSGFGVRDRSNKNDWGSSNRDTNKTTIKTYNITPNILFDYFGKYKIIAGFDFYKDVNKTKDYSRITESLTGDSDIKKTSRGYYLQAEANLIKPFFVTAGYRREDGIYKFNYTDYQGSYTNVDDSRKIKADAINAGLSYIFLETNKVYMNFNKSFRLPATDEFLLYDWSTWPAPTGRLINADLNLQKGYSYNAGLDFSLKDIALVKASGFWIDTKNEIYYDPYLYENRNYEDNTRRKGFEAQLDLLVNEFISVYAAYTFTKAEFKNGSFAGKEIPAVPKHIFATGANIKINNFLFNVDFKDTGKSRFISDQENNKGFVSGYFVADIGCSFQHKGLNLYGKINNVFNEKYSEYGVRSDMYDTKNYYPSPERNYIVGIKFEF